MSQPWQPEEQNAQALSAGRSVGPQLQQAKHRPALAVPHCPGRLQYHVILIKCSVVIVCMHDKETACY